MSKQSSLRVNERVVKTILMDSSSISQFADCPDKELVASYFRRRTMRLLIPLDVLLEVMRTPCLSRRYSLLRPLRLVLKTIDVYPISSEVIAVGGASVDLLSSAIRHWTMVGREMIRSGIINQEAMQHDIVTSREARRSLKSTQLTARRMFQTEQPEAVTLLQAAHNTLKDRSFYRQFKTGLGEVATALGQSVLPRQYSFRRNPILRCWGLGWVHLARQTCVLETRREVERLPGHTDLAQLSLLSLCDGFVSDDYPLRVAAMDVRDGQREGKPWIAQFSDLRGLLLSSD